MFIYLQVEMLPRDDGTSIDKRKQYQNEVDEAKRKLGQQNALTAVEQVKVENCVVEEEQLIKQQEELRADVVELTRLAQIKADEREQKARDMQRAEVCITQYIAAQVLIISEQRLASSIWPPIPC